MVKKIQKKEENSFRNSYPHWGHNPWWRPLEHFSEQTWRGYWFILGRHKSQWLETSFLWKPKLLRDWFNVQKQWYNTFCQVPCVIKTILGGLNFGSNIKQKLYSIPSGFTYSLDMLERTLKKVEKKHGERSWKRINSPSLSNVKDVETRCWFLLLMLHFLLRSHSSHYMCHITHQVMGLLTRRHVLSM